MINWLERIEWAKSLHVWLILASFLALFFPSHIVWTQCLIASVAWAVYVWLGHKRFQSQSAVAWTIVVFYFILCISGLWAANKSLFLDSIRMKVILLGMPFCFLVWNQWTAKQFRLFSRGLILAIAISAIFVLVNYCLHWSEILDNMLRGQPIPVPFKDHIRYSILLCFGLILSIHQADSSRKELKAREFYFWLLVSFGLFGFIQFLAVKTGMLISWIIILCFVAYKIWIKKLYLKGGLVLIFLLGTVYFMADYIPTIKNKLSYFLWDIGKYKEKNYQTYSDGERIVSIMKGFEIARQNPAFGVGEGNLVLQMDSPTNKLPHNQFIVVWAQNGIFGLMSFIAVFVISFWSSFKKQNWLVFAYTLAMVVANMLEPMLETQLGLTIFSLPLLIVHSINLYKEN
jgi:hypothetical protein